MEPSRGWKDPGRKKRYQGLSRRLQSTGEKRSQFSSQAIGFIVYEREGKAREAWKVGLRKD